MAKKIKSKVAVKYLSTKALAITPRERKYLLQSEKILSKMEPEQIIQIKGYGKYQFDMVTAGLVLHKPGTLEECGTAGCIAGLANLLAKTQEKKPLFESCYAGRISGNSRALDRLFFPAGDFYASIKPKQAAHSIRHFLLTGRALNVLEVKEYEASK